MVMPSELSGSNTCLNKWGRFGIDIVLRFYIDSTSFVRP